MGYQGDSSASGVTVFPNGYRSNPGLDVTTNNMILGYSGNNIASDVSAATIGGGGNLHHENIIGGSTANVGSDTVSNVADLVGSGAHYAHIGGGYDNVVNGLACGINTGMHCKIEQAASHGIINGGSFHKILSGNYGTIGGGTNNEVDADNATVGGGTGNKIVSTGISATIGGGSTNQSSGNSSTVAGGTSNNASANTASIGGGSTNTASGNSATVAGGFTNQATQTYASIGGGFTNTASGSYSTVPGGRNNSASANYAVAIGFQAKAQYEGQFAQADGMFAVQGDAQRSTMVLRRQTTDATSTLLGLGGAAASPGMAADTTWQFTYKTVARRTDVDGESMSWEIKGLIQKGATGNAALVGTPTKTVIAQTAGLTWDLAITAGTSTLNINATGEAAKTINWVAQLDLVEVTG